MPLKIALRARIPALLKGVAVSLLILQTEACFYVQAVRGHTDLMSRRRPVSEVLADENSPEELKQKLELVTRARDFAVTSLLLPDNDSYRSYADLEREFVVWNVFAAPEFSLEPKTWCFPVAGCVAYRGYFSEEKARQFGEKLSKRGYDIAYGGVSAYSTLGRFSDPVLNTMMHWTDTDLISTIFHELAHQKLYVKGDSAFNESFATTVADIGIERWYAENGESTRPDRFDQSESLRQSMLELVSKTRQQLLNLYSSEIEEATMRLQKREILDSLSQQAQGLVDTTGGESRNWLAGPLNNARLVSADLYEGQVDTFKVVLAECDGELKCFYENASALAKMSGAERREWLQSLADS